MRSFFIDFNVPVGRDAEMGECSRGQQIDTLISDRAESSGIF